MAVPFEWSSVDHMLKIVSILVILPSHVNAKSLLKHSLVLSEIQDPTNGVAEQSFYVHVGASCTHSCCAIVMQLCISYGDLHLARVLLHVY